MLKNVKPITHPGLEDLTKAVEALNEYP